MLQLQALCSCRSSDCSLQQLATAVPQMQQNQPIRLSPKQGTCCSGLMPPLPRPCTSAIASRTACCARSACRGMAVGFVW